MTQLYAYDADTRTVFYLPTGDAVLLVEDADISDVTHATGRLAAVGMRMAARRLAAVRRMMEARDA